MVQDGDVSMERSYFRGFVSHEGDCKGCARVVDVCKVVRLSFNGGDGDTRGIR